MKQVLPLLAVGLLVIASGPPSVAGQSPTVSGRVVWNGAGVGNAVVSMYPVGNGVDGAGRPPFGAGPRGADVSIDQIHLRFVPQVVTIRPGQTVTFVNSDRIMHNVFGPGTRGGDSFDLGTYPLGESASRPFDREGVHTILCHVHPEMVAYVVVVDAPFSTVTRSDGRFVLRDVPPGRYRVSAVNPSRRNQRIETEWSVPSGGLQNADLSFDPPRDAVREGR